MFKNILKIYCILLMLIENILGDAKILEYFQQPGQHLHIKRKTTFDRILEMGYPCEQHEILTKDGYIIDIFRIPYSPKSLATKSTKKRPKVLLQHGLFGTSDLWLLNGVEYSLSFLLADQGYDVWLGNARGNLYGRRHTNLTIADGEFWRFSWHEIGYYDVAQMIDFILEYEREEKDEYDDNERENENENANENKNENENENNNQNANKDESGTDNETDTRSKTEIRDSNSLHYIGHSQGTTVLTVLLSLKPHYQKKLKTINLMAPAVRFEHSEDRLLKMLSPYMGYHNFIAEKFSRQEFMPFNELFNLLAYSVCQQDAALKAFCSPMAFMVEGSFEGKNETALHLCMETHPGGISTEQLLHFMQVYHAGQFRQYDFGYAENLERYQQAEPPRYPLENIEKMLHLWYGDSDLTVSPIDVKSLVSDFSNIRFHRIADNHWSHGDFLFSLKVGEHVYEPIIEIINDYERGQKREERE